jgi:hypothetical protein
MSLPNSAKLAFIIAMLLVWALMNAGYSFAQDRSHETGIMGEHPSMHDDPYGQARSIAGANCCHGADCAEYIGPPPKRVTQDGVQGWLFADKYFFEDSKQIDLRTLRRDAWGIPSICISSWGHPYCFNYPQAG